MRFEDYVADRESRSPEFGEAPEAAKEELAFARQLIRVRVAANLTQAELAERIGTRRATIARLESGRHQPSVETLERLAAVLHVSFEITEDAGLRIREMVAGD